jgi:hypothetical protein
MNLITAMAVMSACGYATGFLAGKLTVQRAA